MTKFEELIQTLKKDGKTEEEIAMIVAEVMRAASLKLYTQSMLMLSDDEKKQVEAVEDEEKAEKLLDEFYKKHIGQTPAQAIDELREKFAKGFLEQYEKDQPSNQ